MERSTTLWLRIDDELSIHKFYPLVHAAKAQPPASHFGVEIEASSGIAYREMKHPRLPGKFDGEFTRLAVLYGVVQPFL